MKIQWYECVDKQTGQRNEIMHPEIDSYVEDNLICIKCTTTLHSMLRGWEWSCQAMVLKQIDTHMEKRKVLTSTVYYTKKKKNSN